MMGGTPLSLIAPGWPGIAGRSGVSQRPDAPVIELIGTAGVPDDNPPGWTLTVTTGLGNHRDTEVGDTIRYQISANSFASVAYEYEQVIDADELAYPMTIAAAEWSPALDVLPSGSYSARFRIEPASGQPSAWSNIETFTYASLGSNLLLANGSDALLLANGSDALLLN